MGAGLEPEWSLGYGVPSTVEQGGRPVAGAGSQMLTAGGVTYGYDANGNQTSRSSDTFTYDHQNHLTQAVIGGRNSSFVYNGDGLRMSYTVGGSTTDYSWDVAGGLPVILQDGTNTYVYGLDLISATDGGGVQTYYLYDGLGSTAGLADGSGNGVASYGYDVFGAIRSESGGSGNYWVYTGEQRDGQSDLYYLRARYYDPTVGRLLSRDPFLGLVSVPQSLNAYAYALDNPTNLIDPYGLFGFEDIKKVAEATGGFLSSPWGAPVLCNPLTGPVGCTAALWLNRDIIAEAWPYISYSIQVADLLPLADVPIFGQAAGQILDIAAFIAAEIDIVRSGCPWEPYTMANLGNLGVGTLGNLTSLLGVNQVSLIEAGIFASSAGLMTGCDSVAEARPAGGKE